MKQGPIYSGTCVLTTRTSTLFSFARLGVIVTESKMDLFPALHVQSTTQREGMRGDVGSRPAASAQDLQLGEAEESRSTGRSRSASNNSHRLKRMRAAFPSVALAPVMDGVISAVKTPVIEDGRIVNLKTLVWNSVKKGTKHFFYEGDEGVNLNTEENIPEYPIAKSVVDMLKSKEASEEDLRDAIYTDLFDNQNIHFAKDWDEMQGRHENGDKKYKESCLNTVLSDFGENMHVEKENTQRLMMGLQ